MSTDEVNLRPSLYATNTFISSGIIPGFVNLFLSYCVKIAATAREVICLDALRLDRIAEEMFFILSINI